VFKGLHPLEVIFLQLGFNEADTLKSSSILIYSFSVQSIYTKVYGKEAKLIKKVKLNFGENCGIFKVFNQANLISGE
jgi:hypothetical protein